MLENFYLNVRFRFLTWAIRQTCRFTKLVMWIFRSEQCKRRAYDYLTNHADEYAATVYAAMEYCNGLRVMVSERYAIKNRNYLKHFFKTVSAYATI